MDLKLISLMNWWNIQIFQKIFKKKLMKFQELKILKIFRKKKILFKKSNNLYKWIKNKNIKELNQDYDYKEKWNKNKQKEEIN